jgi:hypothetical protein
VGQPLSAIKGKARFRRGRRIRGAPFALHDDFKDDLRQQLLSRVKFFQHAAGIISMLHCHGLAASDLFNQMSQIFRPAVTGL